MVATLRAAPNMTRAIRDRTLDLRRPGMIGAGLSLASLPVHFLVSPALSVPLAALVLVLVAGIYIGFAVQDVRFSRLVREATVAVTFPARR